MDFNVTILRADTHRSLATGSRGELQSRRARDRDFSLLRIPKRGLRQVDFVLDGEDIRGLEQNLYGKRPPRGGNKRPDSGH